jgi:HK97 gp10 family phage protein
MISANIELGDLFTRLERYSQQIKSEVILAGAAAAASVFYEEVKTRAPVGIKPHRSHGRTLQAGALRAAIYRVYDKNSSSDTRKQYEIGWNRKKAPHGHLVEFGTVKMSAQPFLRPSLSASAAAIQAGNQRMKNKLLEIKL